MRNSTTNSTKAPQLIGMVIPFNFGFRPKACHIMCFSLLNLWVNSKRMTILESSITRLLSVSQFSQLHVKFRKFVKFVFGSFKKGD